MAQDISEGFKVLTFIGIERLFIAIRAALSELIADQMAELAVGLIALGLLGQADREPSGHAVVLVHNVVLVDR